jgi:hypothetical protein
MACGFQNEKEAEVQFARGRRVTPPPSRRVPGAAIEVEVLYQVEMKEEGQDVWSGFCNNEVRGKVKVFDIATATAAAAIGNAINRRTEANDAAERFTSRLTITDLRPNARYSFRVRVRTNDLRSNTKIRGQECDRSGSSDAQLDGCPRTALKLRHVGNYSRLKVGTYYNVGTNESVVWELNGESNNTRDMFQKGKRRTPSTATMSYNKSLSGEVHFWSAFSKPSEIICTERRK